MNYPHLATRLFNTPLMARYDIAQSFASAFDRIVSGDVRIPKTEGRVTGSGIDQAAANAYAVTPDGIGVLTIEGPLVQRAGQMNPDCSPITSYQWINAQLAAMDADKTVKARLLEFDSPGGEVANVFELGTRIRATLNQGKPTWAVANEGAFSAAYALAAGAERIMLPATAMAGSVGVIMLHVDASRALDKKGLTFTPIFAGARKNDFSALAPLSQEALDIGQARVNELYQHFADYVAQMRGIDPAAIFDMQSGIFNATDAVKLGLADGIATFDETLSMLRQRMQSGVVVSGVRMAAPSPSARSEKHEMTDTTKAAAAPDQAATQQAQPVDTAKLQADARTAERARVNAIIGHEEAKGREALAQHFAMATDMPAEAAIAALKAAPKQAAAAPDNRLDTAMRALGNAQVAPDAVAGTGTAAGDRAPHAAPAPANVYAFRAKCVADARR